MDDFEQEYVPEYTEYDSPKPKARSADPLVGWHKSRNKPANVCKYIRGVGLCTVFPYGNAYKVVAAGQFYGPFFTQEEAQIAAAGLKS
jgi:hypothetical protein